MYVRGFLELCRRLERAGSRLPAALPLRGSQVPGNITIDTRALVHLVSLASDEPLLEAMARVWSAPVCDMVAAVPTGQGEQPVAAGSADPAADDGDDEGELVDDDDADATETTMETEAEQPEAPTTGATPPNSPRDRLVQAISALVQQRLAALQAGGDDTAMAVETTARPARPTRAHGNAEYFADRMVDWLGRRLQERPGALPEGVTATRLRDALAGPMRHLMVGALRDTLRQLRRQAYDGPFTREIKDIVWWSRGFRECPTADLRYLFRHMIRTNRVAVSVSLVRCDMQEATRMQLRRRGPKPVPPCCKYLADCSEEELERFRRMRIVVIDPGMGKLLHVFDGGAQMQYSRSQLRVESRHYKFERKLGQLAQTALKHGGRTQTVEQWNTELSEQCARAMTADGQREWLDVANPLDHAMCEHHCNEEYRRLRHRHRCNEQCSYDGMLNRFEKLYGKPGEVLVLFGDWGMRNHHLRGSPPTKGEGMRELSEKRGYDVRLINEAYTSERCSVCCCAGETKTLMQRPDKRRGKEGEMRTIWRLV
ncbi:hypothetical protein CDCA_CDCA13G3694 [Cyanidium caldarium]|uniref:Transposase n=1 Tax=Cyanidium caldarium TaxID=2771 RepID=A0AAV9IZD7_CYACA|nr:hypothetical protein CDCA_CDCA13G3694 [Cyanidium caldarium]